MCMYKNSMYKNFALIIKIKLPLYLCITLKPMHNILLKKFQFSNEIRYSNLRFLHGIAGFICSDKLTYQMLFRNYGYII